ncbi:MAG: 50S ribosomal protein L6 [Candidatus Paceibacteria bacterium]
MHKYKLKMSKVGKKSILIPEGVKVEISGKKVKVQGPKGILEREFKGNFVFELEGNELKVKPSQTLKNKESAFWGTNRSILQGMIKGVSEGFTKVLEFEGIGYRAEANERELSLFVGYTKPVILKIPHGISVNITKNTIIINGIDSQQVGEFAAKVRKVRLPEPYKGTGIKYQGEVIKRKAGKKLAGAAGTPAT